MLAQSKWKQGNATRKECLCGASWILSHPRYSPSVGDLKSTPNRLQSCSSLASKTGMAATAALANALSKSCPSRALIVAARDIAILSRSSIAFSIAAARSSSSLMFNPFKDGWHASRLATCLRQKRWRRFAMDGHSFQCSDGHQLCNSTGRHHAPRKSKRGLSAHGIRIVRPFFLPSESPSMAEFVPRSAPAPAREGVLVR